MTCVCSFFLYHPSTSSTLVSALILVLHPINILQYIHIYILVDGSIGLGSVGLMKLNNSYRRPGWLGRLSSCLLKSISRVQFSPSVPYSSGLFLA